MIPPPQKGDAASFRAMCGSVYEAVITGVPVPGYVDLDVTIPGCKDGLALRAIRWADGPQAHTAAWPKERGNATEED